MGSKRQRKCVSNEQQFVDQISQLPNDILVLVLSFLTLEDAARTSVLSKRWIDLWMHVTGLNFHSPKLLKETEDVYYAPKHTRLLLSKRQKYIKWVTKILLSHKAICLDVFRIRFDLDESSKKDIDKWLQYAFARRVHRLDLNLLEYGYHRHLDIKHSYDFPLGLLGLSDGNSSAVSPSSSGNGINSDAFFGFKSVRALTFNKVGVTGSVLEFFLHNCPFLEHLEVANAVNLKEFTVWGPSLALKHLEIMYCPELLSLTVCNTNIVSLKVSDGMSLVLNNVPKLVDVNVASKICSEKYVNTVLSWLSCCLSKLEILILHIRVEQLYQMKDTEAAVPQLPKLKQLTFFQFLPCDVSLSSYTSLIRASPNLEKFVLKTYSASGIQTFPLPPPFIIDSEPPQVAFPLQHLKAVEIRGYLGHEKREVGLVKYLAENGVALERIIVDPRDQPLHGEDEGHHGDRPARYRKLAKQQLQPLVPPHVELVFL